MKTGLKNPASDSSPLEYMEPRDPFGSNLTAPIGSYLVDRELEMCMQRGTGGERGEPNLEGAEVAPRSPIHGCRRGEPLELRRRRRRRRGAEEEKPPARDGARVQKLRRTGAAERKGQGSSASHAGPLDLQASSW